MISTITILLLASFNLFLFAYIRWLLKSAEKMETQIEDIWDLLAGYVSHVKSIHELEMYYGDTHLRALIEHGNEILKRIEEFDSILREEQELTFEYSEEKEKKE